MDWPQVQDFNRVAITTTSLESIAIDMKAQAAGLGSQVFAANRAYYVPFLVLGQPFLAQMIAMRNLATVNGNLDVGIYDDQQHRLVSKGSTAQAGANALQTFDITDTLLLPGVYYASFATDSATGTYRGYSISSSLGSAAAGVLMQDTAFPLPDPAVFASSVGNLVVPDISILGRSFV